MVKVHKNNGFWRQKPVQVGKGANILADRNVASDRLTLTRSTLC